MKKICAIIVILSFTVLPFMETVYAQWETLLNIDVQACFSDGGCEVVTRQYTGIAVFYSIHIRCMDAGGDMGGWQSWTYDGVNNATYCN